MMNYWKPYENIRKIKSSWLSLVVHSLHSYAKLKLIYKYFESWGNNLNSYDFWSLIIVITNIGLVVHDDNILPYLKWKFKFEYFPTSFGRKNSKLLNRLIIPWTKHHNSMLERDFNSVFILLLKMQLHLKRYWILEQPQTKMFKLSQAWSQAIGNAKVYLNSTLSKKT
jgi:hypothetical protein